MTNVLPYAVESANQIFIYRKITHTYAAVKYLFSFSFFFSAFYTINETTLEGNIIYKNECV